VQGEFELGARPDETLPFAGKHPCIVSLTVRGGRSDLDRGPDANGPDLGRGRIQTKLLAIPTVMTGLADVRAIGRSTLDGGGCHRQQFERRVADVEVDVVDGLDVGDRGIGGAVVKLGVGDGRESDGRGVGLRASDRHGGKLIRARPRTFLWVAGPPDQSRVDCLRGMNDSVACDDQVE
jgi:hypothetical protein